MNKTCVFFENCVFHLKQINTCSNVYVSIVSRLRATSHCCSATRYLFQRIPWGSPSGSHSLKNPNESRFMRRVPVWIAVYADSDCNITACLYYISTYLGHRHRNNSECYDRGLSGWLDQHDSNAILYQAVFRVYFMKLTTSLSCRATKRIRSYLCIIWISYVCLRKWLELRRGNV